MQITENAKQPLADVLEKHPGRVFTLFIQGFG